MAHSFLQRAACGGHRSWLVQHSPCSRLSPLPQHVQLVPRILIISEIQRQQTSARAAAAAAAAPPAPQEAGAAAAEAEAAAQARLYALYDFFSANGRLPHVQDQHKGVAVGQWSEACRLQQQARQLDRQLASALQSIPGWSWAPQTPQVQGSFEQSIHQLQRFQQRHGRLPRMRSNPRSSPDAEEQAATEVLRELLEQRRRGVLTQQQIDTIDASLPGWRWDIRVRSPPLDAMIQELQAFVQQHGHLPRQADKLPNGFLVGEWVAERRSEHNRGLLEAEVGAALQQVPGWSWNLVDAAFESNLAVLQRFAAEHRRMPTQREMFDGVRIGAWCNKRRLQYKQGAMPADRVALLEAVDGWWWTAEDMPDE